MANSIANYREYEACLNSVFSYPCVWSYHLENNIIWNWQQISQLHVKYSEQNISQKQFVTRYNQMTSIPSGKGLNWIICSFVNILFNTKSKWILVFHRISDLVDKLLHASFANNYEMHLSSNPTRTNVIDIIMHLFLETNGHQLVVNNR